MVVPKPWWMPRRCGFESQLIPKWSH